jgi:hypothetical protein
MLRLSNDGNLDEVVRIAAGPLPAGWAIDLPGDLALAQGAQGTLNLTLRPAPDTPAGTYPLSVLLVAEDGAVQMLNLTVTVALGANPVLSPGAAVLAQPGLPAEARLPVENRANVPVRVHIEAAPGEPWPLEPSQPLALAPGENASVAVAWRVPRAAPDGTTDHAARLLFEPTDGQAATVERTARAQVEVGRPHLSVSQQGVLATPGGRLVRFTVLNDGSRPAAELELELRAGGAVRDRTRIDLLAPGSAAELALLDAVGTGTLQVVVDPRGLLADAVDAQTLGSGSHGASSLAVPLALAVALAAAARRRA